MKGLLAALLGAGALGWRLLLGGRRTRRPVLKFETPVSLRARLGRSRELVDHGGAAAQPLPAAEIADFGLSASPAHSRPLPAPFQREKAGLGFSFLFPGEVRAAILWRRPTWATFNCFCGLGPGLSLSCGLGPLDVLTPLFLLMHRWNQQVPADIVIAQSAKPLPIANIAADLGLRPDELELYGPHKAKVFKKRS